MGEINRPPQLSGTAEDKIEQMWQYLWALSETLNGRLNGIGSNELTDRERETLRPMFGDELKSGRMISMKDMIIRTAESAQSGIKDAKNKAGAALAIGKGFVDGTDCGAATDVNSLTEQGTYYFTSANAETAINAPTTSAAFWVIVIRRQLTATVDAVHQFALSGTSVWRRTNGRSTESGWSEWTQLIG